MPRVKGSLTSANFIVAGATQEGRQVQIKAKVWPGVRVSLVREPDNAYDSDATAIVVTGDGPGAKIGYVPREKAARVAEELDSGRLGVGYVTKMLGKEG